MKPSADIVAMHTGGMDSPRAPTFGGARYLIARPASPRDRPSRQSARSRWPQGSATERVPDRSLRAAPHGVVDALPLPCIATGTPGGSRTGASAVAQVRGPFTADRLEGQDSPSPGQNVPTEYLPQGSCRSLLSGAIARSVTKFAMPSTSAISNFPRAVAAPIAPVVHMLAAVAVPRTPSPFLRIAPPPINPIPVIKPWTRRDRLGLSPVANCGPRSTKPQLATATRGNVRKPADRALVSRSHATGKLRRYATATWPR